MSRGLSRDEREELDHMLEYAVEYYLDQGVSRGEAYDRAAEAVHEKTGYRANGPAYRALREAAYREDAQRYAEETAFGPSQRHTEESVRNSHFGRNTQSGSGTEYDRMFQNGTDLDAAARTNGKSLSVEEIMWRANQITMDLLRKDKNEGYARRQGEQFMIREMGKLNEAELGDTDGHGQSARSEYGEYGSHGAHRATSARAQSARSEYYDHDSGFEEPHDYSDGIRNWSARSEYGSRGAGPEQRYDTSYRYTEEQLRVIVKDIYESWIAKGVHPDEARQEAQKWFLQNARESGSSSRSSGFNSFSDMRDALDDDEGHGSRRSGSARGPRAGMPRPPGWEGPEYDQYFTDEPEDDFYTRREPSRYSSRNGPSGFSSDNHNGYDDRSGWYGRSGNDQPRMEPSGVKPVEDLYVLLGVSKHASVEEIKQAHRKLCIKHHPDRVKGGTAAKKVATEKMAQINQACDVLKHKEMRAFYDRTGLIASMGKSPDA
ncbi:DnaJ-domain-containing protein [Macroventuria anomochaeta]|uniref:DnaJ-domain-containing protein n=1 Tax=Macroventuria anomochaeta TaxID=301207 RepID=A0ACB6S619_9PLEO|nr:DnaJ-domain-containing protein [Macroventuria anomochaeta]KAF2629700.1 DnaJ-domain-containing protein [Macroventuria anomochaeta]